MRVRKLKARKPGQRRFYIDVVLRGSGFASGGVKDRFRCPSETRSVKLHAQRCEMVVDIWQRGRRDILEARLANRFTTDQMHVAYRRGDQALAELMRSTTPRTSEAAERVESLAEAIDEYLAFNLSLRDSEKPRLRVMLLRFVEWIEQQPASDADQREDSTGNERGHTATVHDLTTPNVLAFLSQLTSRRHGKGRPVSAATRNRYRTALGGLASRLPKRRLIDTHFIADGGLAKYEEAGGRLPSWTLEEREAYFEAIRQLRPEFLPVFHLANTGADISEVLSRRVRDVHFGARLTRIDYRRMKTETLPRLVTSPESGSTSIATPGMMPLH